jgi:phosphoribosylformylglycinamidine synthase
MGAAGLTCSTAEMANTGGMGVEIDLDKVPLREQNMSSYEIMLSESQERMLMTVKPGNEEIAFKILQKWGLDYAKIGQVTDSGRFVVVQKGKIEADIPIDPLSSEAPIYDRKYRNDSLHL